MTTASNPTFRIDVHHHGVYPEYVRALSKAGVGESFGMKFPDWTLENTLATMDARGIQAALISVSTPAANVKDRMTARSIARLCNDISARIVADNPARFGAFATVPPLSDTEGVLAELEHALGTLKLDGVALMTNYDLKYLGDPLFEEVFRELNRRKAIINIHPNDPPGVQFGVSSGLMDAPFDTTRAVTSLICTGATERYPEITYILPHGGGTLPYLVHRIAEGVPWMWKGSNENAPKGYETYLKRMYFDTTMVGPDALPSLLSFADPSRVLFGTDYPFPPPKLIDKTLAAYEAFFSDDSERMSVIDSKNAMALFRRLGSRLG